MKNNQIADIQKIHQLLFDRTDIPSVEVVKHTGISLSSISKLRRGERSIDRVNVEHAIRLTQMYDRLT